MRGEIFTFEGKSFFVMGGGESDDAYMREESVSWWEDELPSAEDMRNGVNNIRDTDKNIQSVFFIDLTPFKINYIILHSLTFF